jgi:digeranylgeranylglycerophospholipid reductase
MEYDAVIVGGSFAGLAVASELKDYKVLLIDRKPIGTKRTSACGTVHSFAKQIGCEESILQVFSEGAAYTPWADIFVKLAEPFCTFDYYKFCNALKESGNFDFLIANARGVEKSKVITSKGSFKGKAIVDCSGWQAVLASSIDRSFVDMKKLFVGIETTAKVREDRLAFYFCPDIVENGQAWVFPAGGEARVGLGRYEAGGNLMPKLTVFLKRFGKKPCALTGNYVPTKLREPVVGNMFLAGDSAGQALPLTVEGIRKSFIYGRKCGAEIRGIAGEEINLKDGLDEYREFVMKSKAGYGLMHAMQSGVSFQDGWLINAVFRGICNDRFSRFFLLKYLSF